MKTDGLFILVLSLLNLYAIKGTSDFIAKANPGFLEIEGKGGAVDSSKAKVEGGKVSGLFSVKLDQLKTGIDERDGHMKNYLEADKFPEATFKLNPVPIENNARKDFTGDFTIHGVTKPITGLVEFKGVTNAVARFTVDLTEFGIKVPTYKLLTVGKIVEITVSLEL